MIITIYCSCAQTHMFEKGESCHGRPMAACSEVRAPKNGPRSPWGEGNPEGDPSEDGGFRKEPPRKAPPRDNNNHNNNDSNKTSNST